MNHNFLVSFVAIFPRSLRTSRKEMIRAYGYRKVHNAETHYTATPLPDKWAARVSGVFIATVFVWVCVGSRCFFREGIVWGSHLTLDTYYYRQWTTTVLF